MDIKHTLTRARIEVNTNDPVFIKCPECARSISWVSETQKKFEAGGVGHQCSNCNAYIGVVECTGCRGKYILTDQKWCSITQENPFACSKCSALLVPKIEDNISLATTIIETKVLHNNGISVHENDFIYIAKSCLKK